MLFALVKQYEIEHGLASGNYYIYKSVALYHSENSAQLLIPANSLDPLFLRVVLTTGS